MKLQLFALIGILVTLISCNPEKNQIRVMSYNIHNGMGLDKVRDLNRIATIISGNQPDLVALQEVDSVTGRSGSVNQIEELGRLTGMHPYFSTSITFDGGKYGNAVLARQKALKRQTIPLPGAEPRSLLLLEFPDYFFLATHFALNLKDQLQSCAIIDSLTKNCPKPLLLAGDLNAKPEQETIKCLSKTWGITLPSQQQTHFTYPADSPTQQIDYILYRPTSKWQVKQFEVVAEPVASDHRPITCILELK